MFKNVASQKIAVVAYDTSGEAYKTGDAANITATISKDGGSQDATNDVNPTELGNGIYLFDMTQAETNADIICFVALSGTANITIERVVIYTQTPMRGTDIGDMNDFDPANDAVASVTLVDTTTDVTNDVTTDTASRTASKADVSALALEATVAALNDFDPANDAVANVTLTATTTTNTDMRGTDSAALDSALAAHDGKLDTVDSIVDIILQANVLFSTTIKPTGRTTEKLELTNGSDVDGTYVGMTVVLDNNDGAGEFVARAITDYDGSSQEITFTPSIEEVATSGGPVYIIPGDLHLDSDVQALASSVASLNDFDPANDAVASVTLVDTTTDVTNDVVTDSASRTASKADVSALALEATVAALNDITIADILAAVIDGTIDLETSLKRILSQTANSAAVTGTDPRILAYKDSAGTSTVVTHSVPVAGTGRTASF